MTATSAALQRSRPTIVRRFLASRFVAVVVILLVIIGIWYVGSFLLNAPFQRDLDARGDVIRETPVDFVVATWSQKKPTLPAPHQVAIDTYNSVVLANPTKPSSLLYHAWITLASTLAGFVSGTLLGMLLAVGIVHVKSLDRSLMPWIISSQTIPILALAPILVVVAYNLLTGQLHASNDFSRFVAKALISTYLSFFPVTVGMVKGLRSPAPINLDLMRTYNASRAQVFWKLRLPASLPFLFTSMKVGIAASLVGAIVAELPTGAVAGIGAKLLSGSYYSNSIQMWSALVVGSVLAALLVTAVGITERLVNRRMGARPA
ncbi:MAG TPA: ABC transporter permease [Bauldia sp.]|nr:ABC transporter permease [Bauldia sp.]